jgi:hypothetical protein
MTTLILNFQLDDKYHKIRTKDQVQPTWSFVSQLL